MKQTDTFDPSFFEQLKKAEERHFWFQVRRKWIFDKISKFIKPPAKVLEIGCGTGNVSSFLAKKGYAVTGCECYSEALDMAWPGFRILQGDATNLPFEDNSFGVVCLFDVIEHFQDDNKPVREAVRVAQKGGIIAVTVPAREELWSRVDEVALHKRRYTIEKLEQVFFEAKTTPLLMEYIFMSLYLPMRQMRGKRNKDDYFKIHPLVNMLAGRLFDIERHISKLFPLPIGTSLIAIARKEFNGGV